MKTGGNLSAAHYAALDALRRRQRERARRGNEALNIDDEDQGTPVDRKLPPPVNRVDMDEEERRR